MGRYAMYRRRGTAAAPADGVLILSAVIEGGTEVSFNFDAVIAASPGDWNGIAVNGNSPDGLVSGGNPGDNFVTLSYPTADPDDPWDYGGPSSGLTFAGGRVLSIPQSGLLT